MLGAAGQGGATVWRLGHLSSSPAGPPMVLVAVEGMRASVASMSWRGVSDWKTTITVVSLADVDAGWMAEEGWVTPAEQVREGWPRIAGLADAVGVARVEGDAVKVLRERGVTLWEVSYHRGSDGFLCRALDGAHTEEVGVETGALVSELMGDSEDDERWDQLQGDVVDALLRIASGGALTERAVIIAALVPPLGPTAEPPDRAELDACEAFEPSALPDVAPELVDEVRAALRALPTAPTSGPDLAPEVRRTYQKKAAGAGAALLAVAYLARDVAPGVSVVAIAFAALCLVIILIHAGQLVQQRRR